MRVIGVLLILCAVGFCVALLSRLPVPEELRDGVEGTVRSIAEATAEHDPALQPGDTEAATPPAPESDAPEDRPETAVATVETGTSPASTEIETGTDTTEDGNVGDASAQPDAAKDDPGPVDRVREYVTALGRAAGLIGPEEPSGGGAEEPAPAE